MIGRVFVRFEKLRGETNLAVKLLINHQEYWFPKRFCWNFILNKKLGGNMEIPYSLYKEKFGCEPPDEDATLTIEKHKPEKVEPVTSNEHADLAR